MPFPSLRMEGVTVAYGRDVVVDAVGLTVDAGELVALTGPNGAGKSTVLKAALRLVPMHAGRIEWFGEPLATFRRWRRIGYLPQNPPRPRLPVRARDVVLTGRAARRGLLRPYRPLDRLVAEEAMAEVGADHLARQSFQTLSGGERQKVLLARALASQPDILLLDEPSAALDPASRGDLWRLLRRLAHDRRLAILVVTHDDAGLRESADREVRMERRLITDERLDHVAPSRRTLEAPPWQA